MEIDASSNTGDGMAGEDVSDAACVMFEYHCLHDTSRSSAVEDGIVYIPERGEPTNADSCRVVMPESAAEGEVPFCSCVFSEGWCRNRIGAVLNRLDHVTQP